MPPLLFDQAKAVPMKVGADGKALPLTKRLDWTTAEDLEVLSYAFQKKYPEATLNMRAINGAGNNQAGTGKQVPVALIVRKGGQTATLTCYSSGAAVISGFATDFVWPVEQPEYDALKAEIEAIRKGETPAEEPAGKPRRGRKPKNA